MSTEMRVHTAVEAQKRLKEFVPLIERSIKVSFGSIRGEEVAGMLVVGDATAVTIEENGQILILMVVRLVQYPEYRATRIVCMSGRKLKEAHNCWNEFKRWSISLGADEIEAFCRPAMIRLLHRFGSWKPKFTALSVDLRS